MKSRIKRSYVSNQAILEDIDSMPKGLGYVNTIFIKKYGSHWLEKTFWLNKGLKILWTKFAIWML